MTNILISTLTIPYLYAMMQVERPSRTPFADGIQLHHIMHAKPYGVLDI